MTNSNFVSFFRVDCFTRLKYRPCSKKMAQLDIVFTIRFNLQLHTGSIIVHEKSIRAGTRHGMKVCLRRGC